MESHILTIYIEIGSNMVQIVCSRFCSICFISDDICVKLSSCLKYEVAMSDMSPPRMDANSLAPNFHSCSLKVGVLNLRELK